MAFVATAHLFLKRFKKKDKENWLSIPVSQSALVRTTSTATSILREKLQQADLILPTSAPKDSAYPGVAVKPGK